MIYKNFNIMHINTQLMCTFEILYIYNTNIHFRHTQHQQSIHTHFHFHSSLQHNTNRKLWSTDMQHITFYSSPQRQKSLSNIYFTQYSDLICLNKMDSKFMFKKRRVF